MEEAITSEEIEARIIQAEEAFVRQEYKHSIELLQSIIVEKSDYAPAYRKLAALYLRTKTPEEALPLLNKTLELAPNDPENWNMLGHYNVRFQLWDKALEAFQRSLELSGENPQTEYEIVKIYRSMGDKKQLFSGLETLAKKYPDNINFGYEYAKQLQERVEYRKALEYYEHLMENPIEQLPVALISEWQKLMNSFGRNKEVMQWLKEKSKIYPDSAEIKWLLAVSYVNILEYEEAQRLLMEAHTFAPENSDFLYTLAYSFYGLGQKEKALFYHMKSLSLKPLNPKVLRAASMLHKFNYGDTLFTYLNQATAELSSMTMEDRAEIHYALGHAFESVEELNTAFEHYEKAGICHSQGKANDLENFYILNKFNKKLDSTFFKANYGDGCHSDKPVFILGMIRSGTTLVQTVLSSMEGVYGAGELDYLVQSLNKLMLGNIRINNAVSTLNDGNIDFQKRGAYYLEKLENLAPAGTRRIIDKMPNNFKYAGIIPLILPEASIIHTRRHPVETCLSAYRIMFPAGHYWSGDLRTMGKYYRMYHDLMQHWREVLPEGMMLELKYEEMVNDLETQSKRLATHIGIEWDPVCLDFHKGRKPVRTASATQVTQPIYKTSINRWRKYELYLQPLLDEIGDLVDKYEIELSGGDYGVK